MFVHWRAIFALARLLMDAPADRLFAIWHACGLVRVSVCLIFLRQPAAFAHTLALPLPLPLPYPSSTLARPCPAMPWPLLQSFCPKSCPPSCPYSLPLFPSALLPFCPLLLPSSVQSVCTCPRPIYSSVHRHPAWSIMFRVSPVGSPDKYVLTIPIPTSVRALSFGLRSRPKYLQVQAESASFLGRKLSPIQDESAWSVNADHVLVVRVSSVVGRLSSVVLGTRLRGLVHHIRT